MRIHAQPFCVQKRGNAEAEYEDARHPAEALEISAPEFLAAVADGATETSFSGCWARLLVRAYCRGRLHSPLIDATLRSLRRVWQKEVAKQPLPWFAEEKARMGAFSSLLGLHIIAVDPMYARGAWRGMAIGDSCLLQLRNGEPIKSFPIENSADFNSRPTLLSSNPAATLNPSHVLELEGEWESGDTFLLMTDAIACWFLKETEEGRKPFEKIRRLGSENEPGSFPEWVQQLRDAGELKNDDTTLLKITVQ